MLQMADELG